jgi:uncharacterized membrane protein
MLMATGRLIPAQANYATRTFRSDNPDQLTMDTLAKPQSKINLVDSLWRYVGLLVLVVGLFISAFKLATPYSYWHDELFSVTFSQESLEDLHRLILYDVHPPLYQLLLKGWINLFGDSESSTRSLSWLFAIGSIYLLWKFSEGYGLFFLTSALSFFPSNMLFTFYANETRPYA